MATDYSVKVKSPLSKSFELSSKLIHLQLTEKNKTNWKDVWLKNIIVRRKLLNFLTITLV